MQRNLTTGNIMTTMLAFAAPMIAGNMLQQLYNVADSLIVGQFISSDALAAVGAAYSLMTFITSVIIGLCMGSGALFSFYHGQQAEEKLRNYVHVSFLLIAVISAVLNVLSFILLDHILLWLAVPQEILPLMRSYVFFIFFGILFVFLYNFFSFLLRALGNSIVPLFFLGATVVLNIGLDLLFVISFDMKIEGAAIATVISQAVAGGGISVYAWCKLPQLRFRRSNEKKDFDTAGNFSFRRTAKEIFQFSTISALQQSVMNFGILMIQGLVNSFGPAVMAAFAAVVKVDSFAYMPAQEFGNAYSLFVSQNFGAGKQERIQQGTKRALQLSAAFCVVISVLVFAGAKLLMLIFISPAETEIIAVGVHYLRIEGAFYIGIGILFLLYGYYRGINRPAMSLILTAISLGTRVALAYLLSAVPSIGVLGIWVSIPIGWILADAAGLLYMRHLQKINEVS